MIEEQSTDNEVVSHSTVSEDSDPEQISWTVHPLVENWKRTIVLLIFLLSILAIIFISFKSILYLLLSAILLIGPLYKYFLPFHYCCGIEHIIVTACCTKNERPWSDFRSYYVDKNGVLLSPFAKPTRLENFRGVYVRFGKHPPEDIVNYIHNKLNSET